MHVALTPLLVGLFGALCMEIVRWKQAIDKLTFRTAKAPTATKPRFSPAYALITLLYAVAAGLLCCLFPQGTNPFLYFYVGVSLPKVIGTLAQLGDKALPGAVNLSGQQTPKSPTRNSIEDTSAGFGQASKLLYRTSTGRLRRVDGVYAFLTA